MDDLQDGIYKSSNATYFIKGGKILMKLNGGFYKTTSSFMQGTFYEPLPQKLVDAFDKAYEAAPKW